MYYDYGLNKKGYQVKYECEYLNTRSEEEKGCYLMLGVLNEGMYIAGA